MDERFDGPGPRRRRIPTGTWIAVLIGGLAGLVLLRWDGRSSEPEPTLSEVSPAEAASAEDPSASPATDTPADSQTSSTDISPSVGPPVCVAFDRDEADSDLSSVSSLSWSPDGRFLAWIRNGDGWFWDVETPSVPPTIRRGAGLDRARLTALAWDGTGLRWLAGDETGGLTIWDPFAIADPSSPRRRVRLTEWDRAVDTVAWSGESVAASVDGSLALWDADGYHLVSLWAGHGAKVVSLQFRRDGKALLSLAEDGTLRLWAPSGRLLDDFANAGFEDIGVAGFDRFGWVVTWARQSDSDVWDVHREAGGRLYLESTASTDEILLSKAGFLLHRQGDRGRLVDLDQGEISPLDGLLGLQQAALAPSSTYLASWTAPSLCVQDLVGFPAALPPPIPKASDPDDKPTDPAPEP